ncbi:hypothetical protein ACWGID_20255 [Kribbella sp. NPDC054772]
MEPLNLMVSLSHFANDNRDNQHGLSDPAGRSRPTMPARGHRSWRVLITALHLRRVRVLP